MPRLAKLLDRLHLSSASREGQGETRKPEAKKASLGPCKRGGAAVLAAPQASAADASVGDRRRTSQGPMARNEGLVWSLVLDAVPQNPRVLCRLAAVSRQARMEATSNVHWATWSPMAAFAAPEVADARARAWKWPLRDALADDVPVPARPRHLPYVPEHPAPAGCLHAAFVARMQGLLDGVLLESRRTTSRYPGVKTQIHRALLGAYQAGPGDEVHKDVRALAGSSAAGCFDLNRALVDVPRLGAVLPHADPDVLTEPSLYAAHFARYAVLLHHTPVVNDVRTYFLALRRGHAMAYATLEGGLKGRLDVAMYAVRFGDHRRTHGGGLPRVFDDKNNYPALLAAVPADSPVWDDPREAQCMRQLTGPDKLNDVQAFFR